MIRCYGSVLPCCKVQSLEENPKSSLRRRALHTGISKSHIQMIFKHYKIILLKSQFKQTLEAEDEEHLIFLLLNGR